MCNGTPLSEALAKARDAELCEPDPRDDLCGVDVRRKVVVLARELGQDIELADVSCEPLLPEGLKAWEPDKSAGAPSIADQLIEALKPFDDEMRAKIDGMHSDDTVPVQLSTVDVEGGTATIELVTKPKASRIAMVSSNENFIEIESKRYSASPMILQGPGAGAEITASGLFADLLQLSRTLVEWNIPKIN